VDHNKLIKAAAKKAFAPLGMKQDGGSRKWYDDNGWWATVVEFQPSGWGRGSYLNVGVSWMLYEQSYWTFNVGHREHRFESAANEEQFEAVLGTMTAAAIARVHDYRKRFASPRHAYEYYAAREKNIEWDRYYAGVLAGLSGERKSAERHLQDLIAEPCSLTWHYALRLRAQDLLRFLPEPEFFRDSVLGVVLRCRSARNLEEMPIERLGLP
jgi:hypothetical protein